MLVQVLLPVPIRGTFTYTVPEGAKALPGCRVIVPFGKKSNTGIVTGYAVEPPKGVTPKEVTEIIDTEPIIRHPQLQFWDWISDYYLCTPGEVMKAALPAGLKIESETFVTLNPDWEESENDRLSEKEKDIIDVLLREAKPLKVKTLEQKSGTSSRRTITRLVERGAVSVSERLIERYRTKRETYVSMAKIDLDQAFEAVKSAPKQEKALIAILDLKEKGATEVTKASLMERAGVTAAIITALVQKGILETATREVNRFSFHGIASGRLPKLTTEQSQALVSIIEQWKTHQVTLLHGVTSSGKTELYLHLAKRVLEARRNVLFLVPEIALTTQLTQRVQRVFGDKVLVYHSRFSDNERVDLYKKILHDPEPRIIIGARSSVFLPFGSLGMVIVDEEHESSYKQQDPAPRYNARDAAIVLARMHGAKVILGSATPAIETYHKAKTGKYGLVELPHRFQDCPMPKMELIDMSLEHKKGLKGAISTSLGNTVNTKLNQGKQAILFLNRRGYAPMALCKQCGFVPKCENCDVSLTYHRDVDKLICHYCGSAYQLPRVCPACQEPGMEVVGYGTERIQEEVEAAFPNAKISRLDLDSTRDKEAYENIIDAFSRGKSNILVGTQMVTKGLDFGNVGVVGVVNADAVINYPDFRSAERAFNMIEQVAGRAGRRGKEPGLVCVQTHDTSHPLFPYLMNHDYKGFYEHEMAERQKFCYPPFSKVIYIYLRHRDRNALSTAAYELQRRLAQLLGNRVSQPDEPAVARVQTLYIRRIMLKVENNISLGKVKELLEQVRIEAVNDRTLSGVITHYDVDPY